jgi:hypothetical protein
MNLLDTWFGLAQPLSTLVKGSQGSSLLTMNSAVCSSVPTKPQARCTLGPSQGP